MSIILNALCPHYEKFKVECIENEELAHEIRGTRLIQVVVCVFHCLRLIYEWTLKILFAR